MADSLGTPRAVGSNQEEEPTGARERRNEMEAVYYAVGIVAAELTLVGVVTWVVIQMREQAKAPEAESRLAQLEREEEELKKAA